MTGTSPSFRVSHVWRQKHPTDRQRTSDFKWVGDVRLTEDPVRSRLLAREDFESLLHVDRDHALVARAFYPGSAPGESRPYRAVLFSEIRPVCTELGLGSRRACIDLRSLPPLVPVSWEPGAEAGGWLPVTPRRAPRPSVVPLEDLARVAMIGGELVAKADEQDALLADLLLAQAWLPQSACPTPRTIVVGAVARERTEPGSEHLLVGYLAATWALEGPERELAELAWDVLAEWALCDALELEEVIATLIEVSQAFVRKAGSRRLHEHLMARGVISLALARRLRADLIVQPWTSYLSHLLHVWSRLEPPDAALPDSLASQLVARTLVDLLRWSAGEWDELAADVARFANVQLQVPVQPASSRALEAALLRKSPSLESLLLLPGGGGRDG